MHEWLTVLREQGWVHLRGVVDPVRVAAANQAIDQDLKLHFDPARQEEYDSLSACPDIREHPAIAGLYADPSLDALVHRALGRDRVSWDRGQIAVRWAHNAEPEPVSPHIDGVQTADNGLVGPVLHTFTALVAVFLTPSQGAFSGNFTVWPGSTAGLAEYFRARGRRALLAGMPEIPHQQPVQLEVEPSDVVIANYSLMHGCSVNSSPVERRAVFFRVRRKGLALHPYASLVDPWRDWQPVT